MTGALGYFPMGGGGGHDTRIRGSQTPGRGGCEPCESDSRGDYVRNKMRSRGRGGIIVRDVRREMIGPEHGRRHAWIWAPKTRTWTHIEPLGTREISPGRVVRFIGKEIPSGLLPRGWPRMHITPPNFHLHHVPPGLVPMGERGIHVVHAPSAHVPGHYGWSPVLHRHVWIGAHAMGPSVSPANLPPGAREAFAHMAKQSKANAMAYAHSHTFWGASGARTAIIPGHWQWYKNKHEWCYVEPHVDKMGRPITQSFDIAHAPAAAFGRRPSYLPPLHFWPDENGSMRDAHGRVPSDASITITLPPHARYAQQHGLLSQPVINSVLQSHQQQGPSQNAVLAASNIQGANNQPYAVQMQVMNLIGKLQAANQQGNQNAAAQAIVALNAYSRAHGLHLRYPAS